MSYALDFLFHKHIVLFLTIEIQIFFWVIMTAGAIPQSVSLFLQHTPVVSVLRAQTYNIKVLLYFDAFFSFA
jgi:hypothetical protein